MVEAVKIWNEPNNKSHWDLQLDPEWSTFASLVTAASRSIRSINPNLPIVLGGMSPIDPSFLKRLIDFGALANIDAVAVHGFPLDWNHWQLKDWPVRIAEVREVTNLPIWVTEVGISTFGAEEVQEFGLRRTAELLVGLVQRIHWYSLYDLPRAWPATTRHQESEGSSYYRHFYMGLLDEEGRPKLALDTFRQLTPQMGICQWFHYQDHRLDETVKWLKELGVKYLRTGLSWADIYRPNALEWFDRQMEAIEDFEVTVTLCFTPDHMGMTPHYASPPRDVEAFADFCAWMVSRYAPEKTGPLSL